MKKEGYMATYMRKIVRGENIGWEDVVRMG